MFDYTGQVTKEQVERLLKISYEKYQSWKINSEELDMAQVADARNVNNKIAVKYAEMMDTHDAVRAWAEDCEVRLKKVKVETKCRMRVARCIYKSRVIPLRKMFNEKTTDEMFTSYMDGALTSGEKKAIDISDITIVLPQEITSDAQATDIAESYAYSQVPDYEDAMSAKAMMETVYNYVGKIAGRIDANFIGYGIQVKLVNRNQ